MPKLSYKITFFSIAFILAFLSGTSLMAQVERITWRGWKDCYRISNRQCEVIIDASCGGRVLLFSLNGRNIIYENASQSGKTLTDWNINHFDPDGGRFDFGPERKTQTIHTLSWLGAWNAVIIDNYTVKMTSAADTALGMVTEREFRLHPDSALLEIKLSGTNITDKPMSRHFWGRTLVKPAGMMILPVNHNSRFENGWGQILWGPDRIETSGAADERIQIGSNVFRFHAVGKTFKGGTDATDGWMAYAADGLLFIKKFEVYPEQDYSGSDNMTVIFYSNGVFAEMEPCSPTYIVKPGSRITFSEKWKLKEVPYSEISGEAIIKKLH